MRDRSRAVQCPSEMIDLIGGWSTGKIGEGYGDGFNLHHLHKYISNIY